MTEKIINLIKETKELYLRESKTANRRIEKHFQALTTQQLQEELLFVADMESRAYALTLLLEEIDEIIQDSKE